VDPATNSPDRLAEAAAAVLRQHVPDRDGWCRGCSVLWGRLVFIDQCTQMRWAAAVYAAHGKPIGQAPPGDGSTHATGEARGGEGL